MCVYNTWFICSRWADHLGLATMVSSGDGFIDIQTNNIVVGQSCDGVAMPADIVFTKAQSIRFERNTFIHLGAQGLAIERGSRNNSVIGNVFTDISGTGLRIGTFDTPNATGADQDVGNVISNNYIHDLPVEYHGGVGIFAGYVANTLLSHNEIMNMPYSGISNGWGWNGSASYANNNQIKNNLIYNYMQLLADGGGIYSNGIQGSSIENGEHIEGNVVHDGRNDYSNGIYTDGGSQYITIQNNVLYNNIHDWGGCNPNGDMLFQYNYWQKSLPSWGCDQTPPNTVIANNTTINGSDQAPISILNSAGIEHAYQDIKDGSPSGNVALNMPSGASSEWSTDCSSSKANDGSVNTNDSCGGWSPSSQDANPWWEVDLGPIVFRIK